MNQEARRRLVDEIARRTIAGETTNALARFLMTDYGMSKAAAYRSITAAKTHPPRPPSKSPPLEKPTTTPKAKLEKIIEAGALAHYINVDTGPQAEAVPTDKAAIMMANVLADLRTISESEWKTNTDGRRTLAANADKRLLIVAAQTEIRAIEAYARTIQANRAASGDNVTMHPQHAKFRAELVGTLAGTPLQAQIVAMIEAMLNQAEA